MAARSELSELLAEIVRHFQAGIGSGVSTPPTLPAHLDNLDLVEAGGSPLPAVPCPVTVTPMVSATRWPSTGDLEAFEPPEGAELAGARSVDPPDWRSDPVLLGRAPPFVGGGTRPWARTPRRDPLRVGRGPGVYVSIKEVMAIHVLQVRIQTAV